MKRAILFLSVSLITSYVFLSCQKSEVRQQQPEKRATANQPTQKEQKLSTEEREKLNDEALKGLAKAKELLEQEREKYEREERQREKKLEVIPGPLTEEEQKFVEEVSDGLLATPNALKTEDAARKYIKIL